MEKFQAASLTSIFIASLIGSPHCAGMCGGFVVSYVHFAGKSFAAHVLYNLGRLFTYTSLGLLAATTGSLLNKASQLGRISALIAGILLIISGILQLTGSGQRLLSRLSHTPGNLVNIAAKPSLESKSRAAPFLIGFVTTFLPCGWLYSFLALAMASADPLTGFLIMLVFWIGTLPMMISIGLVARPLSSLFSSLLPRLTAILVILAGFFSIYSHFQHDHSGHGDHHHSHH